MIATDDLIAMRLSNRLARALPHARVLFIGFHLVAITVAAAPSTLGLGRRSDWDAPAVEAEFSAWAHRLSAVGDEVDPRALRDTAYSVASRWATAHAALRRPFRSYYDCCGTDQMWRLFVAPDRVPLQLQIDVRIDGTWTPVYREHSAEHRFMEDVLTSHRMRGVVHLYAQPSRRQDLVRLSGWLLDAAATSFPTATEVRLRWVRGRLPTPRDLRDGESPPLELATEIVRSIER